MGKPIDDTELCAKVADEIVAGALRLDARDDGNTLAAAVRRVNGPNESVIRRVQKRWKRDGKSFMSAALRRRTNQALAEINMMTTKWGELVQ